MVDGYHALLDHAAQLEAVDPVSKSTFFHHSTALSRRPEISRHHRRLGRLEAPESLLLTESSPPSDHDYDAIWALRPPLGPCPQALSETYPLTAETPERLGAEAQIAATSVCELLSANPDTSMTVAHIGWAEPTLAALPGSISTEKAGRVPRGRSEDAVFRDDERRSLSNHLTPR